MNSTFDSPNPILFGCGLSSVVGEKLTDLGCKKVLVVYDQGIKAAGVADKIINYIHDAGIETVLFDKVEADPPDYLVHEAGALGVAEDVDGIVGIGGGSSLDTAKGARILLTNPPPITAYTTSRVKGVEVRDTPIDETKLKPLIVIPTTAGTGSELTFSSVITDTRNHYKMTVKNAYTAARTAVCDPELTLSVPPGVTASTGVDALTHAIEAFTASCSNPISDAVALYAVELIFGSLLKAFEYGGNLEARSDMLMGSMLAGIAFSHSDVASVHCIAESLGGMYDLPHGACNAIILPYMMTYNIDYCEGRYARIAKAIGLAGFDTEREGAEAAVEAVKKLASDVRLPSFSSLGVDPADYDKIAAASAKNISTESNPRPMSHDDYLAVLKMANGQ